MGGFVASPKLADGEEILLGPAAKRLVDGRGVGGRLYVTDRRLVFQPNVLYRLTTAEAWELPFEQVAAVGDVDRNIDEALAGGLRRRLSIRTATGRNELFDVNHLERVEAEVCDAVQASRRTGGP